MKLSVQMRFMMIAIVPLIFTIFVVTSISISSLRVNGEESLKLYRKSLMDNKIETLRNETEIAFKTVKKYFDRAWL